MTTIAWTTESWNPIRAVNPATGKVGWYCQKVSPGCFNCYAQTWNRFRGNGRRYDVRGGEGLHIAISVDALMKPLQWKKGRRVFVCSMTDLFLDQHTDEMIDQVFAVMLASPQHTFQVLTKRPERARKYLTTRGRLDDIYGQGYIIGRPVDAAAWPLPNVWVGVSAEDQERADERIPVLLETPAAVRWVSYEPALGPIDFTDIRAGEAAWRLNALTGEEFYPGSIRRGAYAKLDWIVVGGESGRGARPFHIEWAQNTIDQCRAAGVAVFVKQLGTVIAKNHPDVFEDSKGENPEEWPQRLRVREYPEAHP